MALLISNCPRCGTENITFDVAGKHLRCTRYSWQPWFEVFCICRKCHRSTVFLISLENCDHKDKFYRGKGLLEYPHALSDYFWIERFISLRDNSPTVRDKRF